MLRCSWTIGNRKPLAPHALANILSTRQAASTRAMAALPGMPSAVPAEVIQNLEAATKPKERAAIINSVVPKAVTYADLLDAGKHRCTSLVFVVGAFDVGEE